MTIKLNGVYTNNLKGIDVKISPESITAIVGKSGSGKSSLAYSTIYSLCSEEFRALEDGYIEQSQSVVNDFSGLVPAISIKQINNNTNPRSTLISYLNITSILELLYINGESTIPVHKLKINAVGNECIECSGRGLSFSIDPNKVVEVDKTVAENPFRNWKNARSDKHHKLLERFASGNNIPLDVPFRDLSDGMKKKLLYGVSESLYAVNFKVNGKYRKRNLHYHGAIADLEVSLKSNKKSDKNYAEKYCGEVSCPACLGSKINIDDEILSTSLMGLRYDQILTLSINDILLKFAPKKISKSKTPPLHRFIMTLSSIQKIGIGYLSLSRSIPSLSGGELQKLNLARLMTAEITGLVAVIDEISSGLHVSDFQKVRKCLLDLNSKSIGLILVEHNPFFIKMAGKVLSLGPGSGHDGGELVDYKFPEQDYASYLSGRRNFNENEIETERVSLNNVSNVSISFPSDSLVAVCGKSGSGKSSFFNGLSEIDKRFTLVSQDLIKAGSRSSVSSYIVATNLIAKEFSRSTGEDEEWFIPAQGKKGACSGCDGYGVIRIPRNFDEYALVQCDVCRGGLFNDEAAEFVHGNFSVRDVYSKSISSLVDAGFESEALKSRIDILMGLGLGHLSLSRRTNTLSGGELKRLKLAKALTKKMKNHVLVVDEPGAGLDSSSIDSLMNFLSGFVHSYSSIILIDHKPEVILKCDYVVEFGPGSGPDGGSVIYSGCINKFYEKRFKKQISFLL